MKRDLFPQENEFCNHYRGGHRDLSHLIKSHTKNTKLERIWETGNKRLSKLIRVTHLLYFKLTLARPVERDITKPRANKEEKRAAFVGGAGSIDREFRIAIKTQLTT